MSKSRASGDSEAPPQADFVYYALKPVSRLNARRAMEAHPESCVCVLVGGNFGLIPLSQLRTLTAIAERSR
ncbi:MAG: hypothetical protein NBV67_02875 [Tagaea sp.]|nr:hypothetical protein [Tagaea sp.]